MVTYLDVEVGQTYSVRRPEDEAPITVEFIKELADGRFKFTRIGTDLDIFIPEAQFEIMRSSGAAIRISSRHAGIEDVEELDPTILLDPDDKSITVRERERRLKSLDKLKKARTLRYYVRKYDDAPSTGRGTVAIRKLITKHYSDAHVQGLTWKPTPATVLRAVDRRGEPNHRTLGVFFDRHGKHDKTRRWSAEVLSAAKEAIDTFWNQRNFGVGDATAMFIDATEKLAVDRAENGRPVTEQDPFRVPDAETFRLWIWAQADWWHWMQKFGKFEADRKFKGRRKAIEATRPLEYVMMDHTEIDAWAVVQDDEGEAMYAVRPWLTVTIDLYSRMVLGAFISFDSPSLLTAMACLRQTVQRKTWLIDQYTDHKGAADGYGRPFTVIVDNGWDFASASFHTSCEAAGIDVIWAPVKTPTFKPHVERLFGTLNKKIWHKMQGGIPLNIVQRRELGIDTQTDAIYTRTQLERAFWNGVVTMYHLETQSGIDMAPALKWAKGIKNHNRATIDDVSSLDKIMGRAATALLTAEGVLYRGHRFHHPDTTSTLLNSMGHLGKARAQRRGATSSRSVQVTVIENPGDASRIYVQDETTKKPVMLPNWNPLYSRGISFKTADKIRKFATDRNLAFHSEAEKAAARVAHREFMQKLVPGTRMVDKRHAARVLDPNPGLVQGGTVRLVDVDSQYDVQHDLASERAPQPLGRVKGNRSGGKSATEKAIATKARNKAAKQAEASAAKASPSPAPATRITEVEEIDDTAGRLARLMAKVNKGNS